MKLPTIYLLRHGQTEWNVEGRYQGQLNSPLTSLGRKQAKSNALKLQKYLNIDEVKLFASPLGRARETAEIMAKQSGLDASKIIFEEDIQEVNYGIFEGQTKAYCKDVYAKEFADREANKFTYVLEGGESYENVFVRLKRWLCSVEDEKVVVVVAHEMVNRALRGIYCNYSEKEMLLLRQPNDMVIKLENRAETILN